MPQLLRKAGITNMTALLLCFSEEGIDTLHQCIDVAVNSATNLINGSHYRCSQALNLLEGVVKRGTVALLKKLNRLSTKMLLWSQCCSY
jgi:hypothetical protein